MLNHKVSVGSICKLTGYGYEKLTRHCYPIHLPQCKQVNPMYGGGGHQKSLLNNSTCVCMCVYVCVRAHACVHVCAC